MVCPVCAESKNSSLPYGGYRYDNVSYPLVRCISCGLKYIVHSLHDEAIAELYKQEAYFDSEYAGGATKSYASNEAHLKGKARDALKKIVAYKKSGKLLDIGCAGGYLLEVAQQEFGFDAYGIEMSEDMVSFGTARGLRLAAGTMENVPAVWGQFDVAYLGDVLEHVRDPHQFVRAISSRLSPHGIIVIEVPLSYEATLTGWLAGVVNVFRGRFGKKYFLPAQHRQSMLAKPPYHLLMFTPRSIRRLLTMEGFCVDLTQTTEGLAKDKYTSPLYRAIKIIAHFLTTHITQSFFGDRMFVVAHRP